MTRKWRSPKSESMNGVSSHWCDCDRCQEPVLYSNPFPRGGGGERGGGAVIIAQGKGGDREGIFMIGG